MKFYSKINPSVKSLLEKRPNISVAGLFWAGWWRFIILVYGSVFIIVIFLLGLGALFGNNQ